MAESGLHLGAFARVADEATLREALRHRDRVRPEPGQMRVAGRRGRVRKVRREAGRTWIELEGLPGEWPAEWLHPAGFPTQ